MNPKPTISVIVPAYNEEKNIGKFLESVKKQDYPKKLVEVIVIDDDSEDKTVEIAKDFGARILRNGTHDPEIGYRIGVENCRGELFIYADADIEIRDRDFFTKLVKPLMENKKIVGAFPRFAVYKKDPAFARFLRYHPLELNPIYEYFCASIEETIIGKKEGYYLCRFNPKHFPPVGICLYRTELIRRYSKIKKMIDLENAAVLAENGYDLFAYVPSAGFYHHSSLSLKGTLRRRKRDFENTYLPVYEERRFKYFDLNNFRDLAKIAIWIIYANLIFPELFRGIYKSVKFRDFACLWQPIISFVLTDYIIFLFIKNKKGREMVLNAVKNKLKI